MASLTWCLLEESRSSFHKFQVTYIKKAQSFRQMAIVAPLTPRQRELCLEAEQGSLSLSAWLTRTPMATTFARLFGPHVSIMMVLVRWGTLPRVSMDRLGSLQKHTLWLASRPMK